VVAQRLCRSLCERCKEEYLPEADQLLRVGYPWVEGEPLPVLYRPAGCTTCSQTGYRGRLALHEVMTVNEEISRLTVARASTDEITRTAVQQGMSELKQDGWLKVAQGRTSIAEVLRVVV
jgi:type IV pilus assembly protein PilB